MVSRIAEDVDVDKYKNSRTKSARILRMVFSSSKSSSHRERMLGKMAQDADVKESVNVDEDMLKLSWLMLRVVRELLGNLSARNHLNTNERMLWTARRLGRERSGHTLGGAECSQPKLRTTDDGRLTSD